jgi:hypothetical protein
MLEYMYLLFSFHCQSVNYFESDVMIEQEGASNTTLR